MDLTTVERRCRFVKPDNEKDSLTYTPVPAIYSFYQLCSFKNDDNLYGVRRCKFDEKGQIINIDQKLLTYAQCKRITSTQRVNTYKIYPYNDVSLIDYPQPADLIGTWSELLNSDEKYTGHKNVYNYATKEISDSCPPRNYRNRKN